MVWMNFNIYANIIIGMWIIALIVRGIIHSKPFGRYVANLLILSGIILLGAYIVQLWILLERPPMRTLGETRLWYALFLSFIGLVIYLRWKYYWFLLFSISFAILFLFLNIIIPENFNKTLMPALISPWFIPHVVVYIFAYALLGASSMVALINLVPIVNKRIKNETINLADNLVYVGFSFLTMGLLFGALWAKEAWGHYWTWDPKETWAFLTWSVYIIYIHLRSKTTFTIQTGWYILIFAFAILLICWFGVNYLPSASNSIHTYTS